MTHHNQHHIVGAQRRGHAALSLPCFTVKQRQQQIRAGRLNVGGGWRYATQAEGSVDNNGQCFTVKKKGPVMSRAKVVLR